MKRFVTIFIFAACGCTIGKIDWRSLSAPQKQEAIRSISNKCAFPTDRIQIVGATEIRFRPQPDDSYETVDCALSELKRYYGYDMGFVGNEAYVGNTQ